MDTKVSAPDDINSPEVAGALPRPITTPLRTSVSSLFRNRQLSANPSAKQAQPSGDNGSANAVGPMGTSEDNIQPNPTMQFVLGQPGAKMADDGALAARRPAQPTVNDRIQADIEAWMSGEDPETSDMTPEQFALAMCEKYGLEPDELLAIYEELLVDQYASFGDTQADVYAELDEYGMTIGGEAPLDMYEPLNEARRELGAWRELGFVWRARLGSVEDETGDTANEPVIQGEEPVPESWLSDREDEVAIVDESYQTDLSNARVDMGWFKVWVLYPEDGGERMVFQNESDFRRAWLLENSDQLDGVAALYGFDSGMELIEAHPEIYLIFYQEEGPGRLGPPPAGFAMASRAELAHYDNYLDDDDGAEVLIALDDEPIPPPTTPAEIAMRNRLGVERYNQLMRYERAMERVQADYLASSQAAMESGEGPGWVPAADFGYTTMPSSRLVRGTRFVENEDGELMMFSHEAYSQWYGEQDNAFGRFFASTHGVATMESVSRRHRTTDHNDEVTESYTYVIWTPTFNDGKVSINTDGEFVGDGLRNVDPENLPRLHDSTAVWFDPTLGWVTPSGNIKKKRSWLRSVVTVVIVAVASYVTAGAALAYLGMASGTLGAAMVSGAVSSVTSTVLGAAMNGQDLTLGDIVDSAFVGAVTAAVTFMADDWSRKLAGANADDATKATNGASNGLSTDPAKAADRGTLLSNSYDAVIQSAGKGVVSRLYGDDFEEAFKGAMLSCVGNYIESFGAELKVNQVDEIEKVISNVVARAAGTAVSMADYEGDFLEKFAGDFISDTVTTHLRELRAHEQSMEWLGERLETFRNDDGSVVWSSQEEQSVIVGRLLENPNFTVEMWRTEQIEAASQSESVSDDGDQVIDAPFSYGNESRHEAFPLNLRTDPAPPAADPVAIDPVDPAPPAADPVAIDPVDPAPPAADPVAIDPVDPAPPAADPVAIDPVDPAPPAADPVAIDPVDPAPPAADPVAIDPVDPAPPAADPVVVDPTSPLTPLPPAGDAKTSDPAGFLGPVVPADDAVTMDPAPFLGPVTPVGDAATFDPTSLLGPLVPANGTGSTGMTVGPAAPGVQGGGSVTSATGAVDATQPTDPARAAVNASLTQYVDQQVGQVWNAHAIGGNAAAIDEILRIRDEIPTLPQVVGNGDIDRAEQIQREIFIRGYLDEALSPMFNLLEDTASDHFNEMLDGYVPGATFENDPPLLDARTLHDVTGQLSRYVEVLPLDRIVGFLKSVEPVWSTSIKSMDQDAFGERQFGSINDFAQITDQLPLNLSGDALRASMAKEFVKYRLNPTGYETHLFDIAPHQLELSLIEPLASGQGHHLAAGIVNELLEKGKDDIADNVLRSINLGVERFSEQALQNVTDQLANRETFLRIVEGFSFLSASPPGVSVDPDSLAVAELEMQNALVEYMEQSDTFLPEEARLSELIEVDAQRLFRITDANSKLLERAQKSDLGQNIADVLIKIVSDDPANGGLASFHRTSSLMLGDVLALNAQITDLEQLGIDFSASPVTLDAATAVVFASRGVMNLPPASGSAAPVVRVANNVTKAMLAGWFGGASAIRGDDALDPAPDANDVDQAAAGVRSGRFAVMGARDTWALAANFMKAEGAQHSSYDLLFSTNRTLFQTLTNGVMWVGVATDALTLANTLFKHDWSLDTRDSQIETGIAAAYLGGNVLFLGASKIAFSQGLAANGLVAGTVGGLWLPGGFVLTAGAGAASWYYSRMKEAERFETPEVRQALAHIGSLTAEGELRPIREVSDTERDPSIQSYVPGMDMTDLIAYPGLSAQSVDSILENSNDPVNPRSSIEVMTALAHRHGMTGRELMIEWFDNPVAGQGLSVDQQRDLVEATFGVDLDASGISDEALTAGLPTQFDMLRDSLDAVVLHGSMTIDGANSLVDYIADNDMIVTAVNPVTADITYEIDASKLRGLVDLGPLVNGQADPTVEVRDAGRAMLAGFGGQSGYRPDSLVGLDFWLQVRGYPPLLAAVQPVAVTPAAQPAPVVSQPVVVAPAVPPGTVSAQQNAQPPRMFPDPVTSGPGPVLTPALPGFDPSLTGPMTHPSYVDPTTVFPYPLKP